MRALDIVDAVAMRAVLAVNDAIAADLNDADRTLNAPIPLHLSEALSTAAKALVEQVFLDVWDDQTSGRLSDDFDLHNHHNAVLANFNNRMLMTLRFMPAVSLDWLPGCQQAIANTYIDRGRELNIAGRGGWA